MRKDSHENYNDGLKDATQFHVSKKLRIGAVRGILYFECIDRPINTSKVKFLLIMVVQGIRVRILRGEKTLTTEWPKFFEIKGRVRLDAFERFLQELPMSKSRAIMVAHFVLAEGCTDTDRAHLEEVVDSYVVDQRLGIAEPAPGVELYFCPPHARTLDMLIKHLPRYTEKLDAIDNGLIGIIVWRKAHLSSTVSPKSSQQRKEDNPKRQTLFASRGPHEQDMNDNVNFVSMPVPPILSEPQVEEDDDDDVPPGFGPPGSREDDDLPEFKFSGGVNPSLPPFPALNAALGQGMIRTPSRPVEQMRELVKKYGQTGNGVSNLICGIALQPWNDDDDDIPEWQPQAPQHGPPPPTKQQSQPIRHSLQLPAMLTCVSNQLPLQPPLTHLGKGMQQPLQPPMNPLLGLKSAVPWQQGAWWPPTAPIVQPGNLGSQPMGGQFYDSFGVIASQPGRDWRPDGSGSRSRGG
ncbi:hypothetical protein Ancab_002304 [Ancistrocladus abbreviatus]